MSTDKRKSLVGEPPISQESTINFEANDEMNVDDLDFDLDDDFIEPKSEAPKLSRNGNSLRSAKGTGRGQKPKNQGN